MSNIIFHSLLLFFTIGLPSFVNAHPLFVSNTTIINTPLKEGQIVADNGSLYRKLIKITNNGYEVQNFYKDTQQKQTDTFIIKDINKLTLFQPLEIYHLHNLIFEGPLTLWFNNSSKAMTLFVKEGNAEGEFHKYYINGQPEITGQYKTGKPEGLWYYWNIEGELEKKIYYKEGIRQWQKDIFSLKGF